MPTKTISSILPSHFPGSASEAVSSPPPPPYDTSPGSGLTSSRLQPCTVSGGEGGLRPRLPPAVCLSHWGQGEGTKLSNGWPVQCLHQTEKSVDLWVTQNVYTRRSRQSPWVPVLASPGTSCVSAKLLCNIRRVGGHTDLQISREEIAISG